MRWNCLTILKLQRLHRWNGGGGGGGGIINFISHCIIWDYFSSLRYNGRNYSFMPGLKLIHVSKRGPAGYGWCRTHFRPWWRHQMEPFSALLASCAGNSLVTGEFPTQRPVTRSFVFFDLRLNKRLSKQSWGWWFETLSRPFRRHYNARPILGYQ